MKKYALLCLGIAGPLLLFYQVSRTPAPSELPESISPLSSAAAPAPPAPGSTAGDPSAPAAPLAGKYSDRSRYAADSRQRQIDRLSELQGDELFAYAADLNEPDNLVRVLYPQYLEAKRDLLGMMSGEGLGKEHPRVLAQKTNLDAMHSDLTNAVEGLRHSLEARMESHR